MTTWRGFKCPKCGASIMGEVDPPPTWDLKMFCCWLNRYEFERAADIPHYVEPDGGTS